MSLSMRLTRAGLALLVFGAICAVLPSTPITYASTNQCTSPNNDAVIITGVTAAGVGGYEFFIAGAKRRKHHHDQDNNGGNQGGNGQGNGNNP